MKKKNAMALVLVFSLVFFLFYFLVFGNSNPFVKYMNVKVTAGVDCGAAWMCWFTENVNLEYSSAGFLSLPKLQWYCGWGGGPKPIEVTLKVENPDMSVSQWKLEQGTCEDVDLVYTFKVPLNKGDGNYKLTATVCGSNWWWQWKCITKQDTFTYAGGN